MIDSSSESTLAKCDECQWWMHAVDFDHKHTARKALSDHRQRVHPGSTVKGPGRTEREAEQAARVRERREAERRAREHAREVERMRTDPEFRAVKVERNRQWRERSMAKDAEAFKAHTAAMARRNYHKRKLTAATAEALRIAAELAKRGRHE